MDDIEALARTIWAEARSDDWRDTPYHDGMEAVAVVLTNRVAVASDYKNRRGKSHPLFGDGSFESACRAKWQFSCWNVNDPNLPKLLSVGLEDKWFVMALEIADRASRGEVEDRVNGATHYVTKSLYNSNKAPAWVYLTKPVAETAKHYFFKGV